MAWFSALILPLIVILSLSAKPTFSNSIQLLNRNNPLFPETILFGDAHYLGDLDAVQLNLPTPSSFGVFIDNSPSNFTSSTSFSSHFTFQIGNIVAMVLLPANYYSNFATKSVTESVTNMSSYEFINANRLLAIEFYPNVCNITSSRVTNVSKVDNVLKEGVNLSSWIDYVVTSKRLEVRVSKLGDPKPVEPLISYRVNLGKALKGEEVLFGLASSSGMYERITYVYGWRYRVTDAQRGMSVVALKLPAEADPTEYDSKEETSSVVSRFVYVVGCGTILAAVVVVLLVWSCVADQEKVQGGGSVHPVDLMYAKIDERRIPKLG